MFKITSRFFAFFHAKRLWPKWWWGSSPNPACKSLVCISIVFASLSFISLQLLPPTPFRVLAVRDDRKGQFARTQNSVQRCCACSRSRCRSRSCLGRCSCCWPSSWRRAVCSWVPARCSSAPLGRCSLALEHCRLERAGCSWALARCSLVPYSLLPGQCSWDSQPLKELYNKYCVI